MPEPTEPVTSTKVSNYAITASFDTAFEVDIDVAAAVKAALALNDARKSEVINHEFHDDHNEEKISDPNGEIQELRERHIHSGMFCTTREEIEHGRNRMLGEATSHILQGDMDGCSPSFHSLVSMMLERVKRLQPEQLSSLVTIVATRGLSALLKEENFEQDLLNVKSDKGGLSDVLVKHVSKLEAEKAAAAAAAALSREERSQDSRKQTSIVEAVPDLGSMMIKRPPSKLEREKQAAKELGKSSQISLRKVPTEKISSEHTYQSLDQILVKHMSKLEKEKLAAAAATRLVHQPDNVQASKIGLSQTEDSHSIDQSEVEEKGNGKLLLTKSESGLENEELQAANEIVSTCLQMPVLAGSKCGSSIEDEGIVNTILVHQPSNVQISEISLSLTEDSQSVGQCEAEETRFDKLLLPKYEIRSGNEKLQAANERVSTCLQMPVLAGTACGSGIEDEGIVNIFCVPGRVNNFELGIEKYKLIHPQKVLDDVESKSLCEPPSVNTIPSFAPQPCHEVLPITADNKASTIRLQEEVEHALSSGFGRPSDNSSSESDKNSKTIPFDLMGVRKLSKLEIDKQEAAALAASGQDPWLRKKCIKRQEARDALCSGENRSFDSSSAESDKNNESFPLNGVSVRKLSKLEIEKQEAATLAASGEDPWARKKCIKRHEEGDAWGGLSLGNALKRHVSKLEIEQAAWRRAEQEEARKKGFHVR